jgi:ATP-dependent exoDNAse (exonuclease V) beta subunit
MSQSPISDLKSRISSLESLVHPAPLDPGPAPHIEPVVRNIRTDYQHYADDLIGLGDVVHAVLEQISNGHLTPDPESLAPETQRLIRIHGLPLDRLDDYVETVLKQIAGLRADPELWDIIRPREDGRAELPFMLKQGEKIYSGRIDRVILTDKEVRIYDYKTYAIKEEEIPTRAAEYHNQQLKHYARACEALYPGKEISTYLIFTALPKLIKTG